MARSTFISAISSLYRQILLINQRHNDRAVAPWLIVAIALGFNCLYQLPQVHADSVSAFDNDLEGWTQFQNSGPNFDWIAGGGKPAGHLGVTDNTNEGAYVQPPASHSTPARYNGSISFDLKPENLQELPSLPGIFKVRVGLQRAGLTRVSDSVLATLSWANCSFQLNESAVAGWRKSSGISQNYSSAAPLAALAEMQLARGGLTRLVVSCACTCVAIASTGAVVDRTYIDNIRLTTVSEPSLGLIGSSLILCGICFRRKRSRYSGGSTEYQESSLSMQRRAANPSGLRLIVLAVIAFCSQVMQLRAQDREWTNTTNTFAWYDFNSNWSPSGAPSSSETASFLQNATYQVWWDGLTAANAPSVGRLSIANGNVTFLNIDSSPQHEFTINGTASPNDLLIGFGSALDVRGLHVRSLGGVTMEFGSTLTVDGAHSAGTTFTASGVHGIRSMGDINVVAGGILNCSNRLMMESGGQLKVSGNDSRCVVSGELLASGGDASLLAEAGGKISSVTGRVGFSSNGRARVTGAGSEWNNSGELFVGYAGIGQLVVDDGGRLTSGQATLESGEIQVAGNGSQWINSGNLLIGRTSFGSGPPTEVLTVATGGLVTVNGETQLQATGSVNIQGGRFEFGQMAFSDFGRISGTSGSLAGNMANTGYASATSLAVSLSQDINVQDVTIVNSGTLYGDGSIRFGLYNTAAGEIEAAIGERLRFAGNGNVNEGEINNFGGQIRFDQGLSNSSGGIVAGRGQFIANGSWSNNGAMAFSAGITDVLGDVYNDEGGVIVTTGHATTTFHDDVTGGGGEFRTAVNSSTVFLGSLSGTGNFTGLGTVFMEGDLRPGNSPGSMSFGGDLVMSDSASVLIELGGLGAGEFDQLFVSGDLVLESSRLDVSLWNGFVLTHGMQFLVADVEGELLGQFSGLSEGSLVGNFGGTDLFITYRGFNGNAGVGFFTSSIPEPTNLVFLGIVSMLALVRRRQRR